MLGHSARTIHAYPVGLDVSFGDGVDVTAGVLEDLKKNVRSIAQKYRDRMHRARRIYIEERSVALSGQRELEYEIKSEVAKGFGIRYSDVYFCGSAQLGFSVKKNRTFLIGVSDLDVACVSDVLFQRAWIDVVQASRSFSDLTVFSGIRDTDIQLLKDQILRRGMIRVGLMPRSTISREWQDFEDEIGRRYRAVFGSIKFAIYMNEYAFCWKQDSALAELMGR